MEEKKLLIVGLDPGITIGYAVLDIEGNLIHVASSKQFELNRLISESIKFGKVLLVGTDKHKVPRLVEDFATKLGARVISPEEDISVDEKRDTTLSFDVGDEHQGDALASALLAYKSVKPLLEKIDYFAKKNGKHGIKNKIREMVIMKQVSIKTAVGMIERKEEHDKIIEKAVMERKLEEKDFLKLYNKLKDYEAQIRHLKNYSNHLKNKINELEKIKGRDKKTSNKAAGFREKRIISLERMLSLKERDLEQLRNLLRKLNNRLSNINDYYLLKKLDNLGIKEFDFKNKLLNIRKNDMLLVEDTDIASEKVIEFLKDKVFVVVHKKPISKNAEKELPFIFINAKSLSIDEDKYFGFVNKKQFEAEKSKIDWVKKMVEDYKREKLVVR